MFDPDIGDLEYRSIQIFSTGKTGCQISSPALIISTVIKTGENQIDFDPQGFKSLPFTIFFFGGNHNPR